MLDVVARSQRGRICEYRNASGALRTPCVLRSDAEGTSCVILKEGGRTVRILGLEVAVDPLIKTSAASGVSVQPMAKGSIAVMRLPVGGDEILPDDAEVVIVPNAYEVKDDFRRLVDQVMRARMAAGYGRLLVMLGIADPANIALLTYMGVDAFDDGYLRVAGIGGTALTPEGSYVVGGDQSMRNVEEAEREVAKVRVFAQAGRLRELVDQRSFSSAEGVAALRVFDADCYDYQEKSFPVNGPRFSCNTVQSLCRPDIVRYERAMHGRYFPPRHKKILLLLPCSAKKPYHVSKSHRLFASAIHTAQHDTLVHEVVVTSPLGIVPRELDVFYPANAYDIPVTGEWKPEERERIRRMLADLVSKGNYERVVSHLGEDDALVKDMFEGISRTSVGDPVSPVSLRNLDGALRAASEGMGRVDYGADRDATARAAMAFQFGPEVAGVLMEGARATGKYPYWKVFREEGGRRTQMCMMSAERGMFSLSPEGARTAAEQGYNIVEIQSFELKGSLFAVGVDRADHRIRIGDEAVIVSGGKAVGVGVAEMCGEEMEQARRGVAVRVRHKFRCSRH